MEHHETNQNETQTVYEKPEASGSQGEAFPYQSAPQQSQNRENVIAGIVGAFLFSLIGGVLYFIIYQFGYIAGICGLITVVLSSFGYQLFSGRKNSLKGVFISVIMSALSIVLAEYLGLSYAFYDVYRMEISAPFTFFDAVRMTPEILEESEVMAAFVKDLGIAFALGAVASFSNIRNAVAESRSR